MAMKKQKPPVAVVLGILHIVFGSLGLVCNLCGMAGVGVVYFGANAIYQQASPTEKKELEEIWQQLNDSVPGFIAYLFADMIGSMLLGLVLLIAGIGLLRVKLWARQLSIIWALVRFMVVMATLVYTVLVVNPGMQKFGKDMEQWTEKMQKRQQRPGQPAPAQSPFGSGMGGTGNPALDNIMSYVGAGISLAYAFVVLVLMLRPSTVHAFVRYNSAEDDSRMDSPPSQDYYDDDYERQRRELPPPTTPEPPPP
jgi:hypothetical protein